MISLCVATYRRPDRLAALLEDLSRQRHLPDEVIIVDNDPAEAARAVVEQAIARGAPFPIRYDVQPVKNISLTRNKTVALARGEWVAFIDDDERAPELWLEQLFEAAARFGADGVLGPVDPIVPPDAPSWIRRGRFYDFPRMQTGTLIPPNRLRFGNVLLRGSWLRGAGDPFDAAYGLTGGEDGDLLSRLMQRGARIVWCDEAVVLEPVEQRRLSLQWLLRRSLSGGQDFARHSLAGRYGPMSRIGRVGFFSRALLQTLSAAALAVVSLPMGRHRAARWLTKVAANIGKLSIFCGWQYREYA
ncbi:MAG: glycosyltransferase family 2 protein [Gammaproteobacteria bacterium]